MATFITDFVTYRWRYKIGYTYIALVVVLLLITAGFVVPGALSSAEINSVLTSHALSLSLKSFDPHSVINLPYYLLQRLSFEIFGVTQISIKLPSLLLAGASIIGMLILLQAWFKRNVAVFTTVLIVTTGQFMFIAQSGTPSIMYVFLSVWLLVAALRISRHSMHGIWWKIAVFFLAALSLYTPLSAYILAALLSAAALHPHLRYIIRKLSRKKLAISALVAAVLLVPLGYALYLDPSIGLRLLGIPPHWPNLVANGWQLISEYVDFISPSSGTTLLPVYGLGSLLLIILGILRLVTTNYTARSYIITAWVILLIPIMIINPSYVSVTFVPVILLMAMGVETLFSSWYRLFPLNPYARVAGLIPLFILIVGMIGSGVNHYVYSYTYNPDVATNFSNDLQLLNAAVKQQNSNVTLVADSAQAPFYDAVASYNKHLSVVVTPPASVTQPVIFTHDAKSEITYSQAPYRIITNQFTDNADRFYIYK